MSGFMRRTGAGQSWTSGRLPSHAEGQDFHGFGVLSLRLIADKYRAELRMEQRERFSTWTPSSPSLPEPGAKFHFIKAAKRTLLAALNLLQGGCPAAAQSVPEKALSVPGRNRPCHPALLCLKRVPGQNPATMCGNPRDPANKKEGGILMGRKKMRNVTFGSIWCSVIAFVAALLLVLNNTAMSFATIISTALNQPMSHDCGH